MDTQDAIISVASIPLSFLQLLFHYDVCYFFISYANSSPVAMLVQLLLLRGSTSSPAASPPASGPVAVAAGAADERCLDRGRLPGRS